MKSQIDLLKEFEISVRGRMGQHLLTDRNIQNKIVDLLSIKDNEWILEVGPGLGALTGEILNRGARVLAIEKDERFVEVLSAVYLNEIKLGRLILSAGDALKADYEALFSKLGGGPPRKMISNLPYYITGPLLFQLFELSRTFDAGVFMMQLEVAKRLFAEPGNKDYGRLTLNARLHGSMEHAFDVSPGCFVPPPQVKSSVVKFHFNSRLQDELKINVQDLSAFISICFSERRKKLLSVLGRRKVRGIDKARWEKIFQQLQIPPDSRPEQLMIKDFISLAESSGKG